MIQELRAEPLYYMAALVILFGISLAGKLRSGRTAGALEWILLFPFLYLQQGVEIAYLAALFLFSLYVLWRGYAEEWRFKINFGTVLFIGGTLVAYGKLTWDFMDKSVFFLIGGLLLLGLSWLLNRRKKQFFHDHDAKEGNLHD
ncbi:LPXTG cell wall anchor domain-containing protein [Paenibacillus sp. P26]|nr:LPXTG cell wall anchor domain-containing protein [Paenibacillus sp. P26]